MHKNHGLLGSFWRFWVILLRTIGVQAILPQLGWGWLRELNAGAQGCADEGALKLGLLRRALRSRLPPPPSGLKEAPEDSVMGSCQNYGPLLGPLNTR